MFQRLLNPLPKRSFFLFGARGTGKTTWLMGHFKKQNHLYLDLLEDETESRYSKRPGILDHELQHLDLENRLPRTVIIDEVQKIPKLLDIAQKWIQKKKLIFIFSGSSARKLKRGAANLLAGRANSYTLFPLSFLELEKQFQLEQALQWGTLPECATLNSERGKKSFLRAYCQTYLKEEILVEQLIRKLPPFRNFLEILAQNNGKLLSLEKFSREVGVDHKTIASYIDILEDTYLGLLLRPFHPSLRKSQLQQPKFYFFDLGVKRQLDGTLGTPLIPSTSAFGDAFESWLIHEVHRINQYFELDYRLSFYRSKHGAEVDLILSKGSKRIFVEIKSTEVKDTAEISALARLTTEWDGPHDIYYVSRDLKAERMDSVTCLHYSDFLKKLSRGQEPVRIAGRAKWRE